MGKDKCNIHPGFLKERHHMEKQLKSLSKVYENRHIYESGRVLTKPQKPRVRSRETVIRFPVMTTSDHERAVYICVHTT
jgi:hypothetical protein